MRIVVLGGTGFVGARVVDRLVSVGHDLTIVHRRPETQPVPSVEHLHVDFSELGSVVQKLGRADVVIDMVPHEPKSGAHGLPLFAGQADRVVLISSGDVYRAFARLWRSEPGDPDPVPLVEDAPKRSTFAPDMAASAEGALDNLEAERVSAGSGLLVTTLRLPAVYGPRDPQHRIRPYVQRMRDSRQAIFLDERQAGWRWSRGFIDDVASGIALAATDERAAGRAFNIASEPPLSEVEWVEAIANAFGWNGRIIGVPPDLLPEEFRFDKDERQHMVMDSRRIRAELGYEEGTALLDGLRTAVEWELSQPDEGSIDYGPEDTLVKQLGPSPAG